MVNDPIVDTPINGHYKKFVAFEADDLCERIGVNYPQEMTYLDFEELIQEWHEMGISITFDVDVPEV